MADRLKVVVLDDDPTGSQTVHGCPLLLRWDAQALRQGLEHPSPLLFVLANPRALDPAAAAQRVREICRALKPALELALAAGAIDHWLIVSRGDSTLRGHFPLECEVISKELGPFDATLLAPAFLPGGRTTVDGVHRLHGEPVHTTPFARDRLFGYSTSFLPDWVAEKSGGRLAATEVERISLATLEAALLDGGELLCQRDAFLCAAMGTQIGMAFNKKLGAGFFGGEGFILQRLNGDGMAFIHAGGMVVRKELKGEKLLVDTGCLVAFTNQINYSIERAGNLKSMVFGGEGLFLATLQGHGTVWLQSLPFGRMAARIVGAGGGGHGVHLQFEQRTVAHAVRRDTINIKVDFRLSAEVIALTAPGGGYRGSTWRCVGVVAGVHA